MFELAKFLQQVYESDSTRPDVVAEELLRKMSINERLSLITCCSELGKMINETMIEQIRVIVKQARS